MKNKRNFEWKWSLLIGLLLLCGMQGVEAQHRLTPKNQEKMATSRAVLGRRAEELLKRYGKPTVICFLPDSPPVKLLLPDGVTQLSEEALPLWARSVAFRLKGHPGSMLWFYKRGDKAVNYLIDYLGYVEGACIVAGEKPAATGQEFEVSTLPDILLGQEVKDVVTRYGYPDQVSYVVTGIFELRYLSRHTRKSSEDTFATVFTVRDGRVARVYSYFDFPGIENRPVWEGRFFLLKPDK